MVEAPSSEISESQLAIVLGKLLWVALLGQGVGPGQPLVDLQRSLPASGSLGFCDDQPEEEEGRKTVS